MTDTLQLEWSARHKDLYLTTHNIHKRQISMHSAGIETATPPSDLPQTHAVDGTSFSFPNIVPIRLQPAREAMFIFKRAVISLHDCRGLPTVPNRFSTTLRHPFKTFTARRWGPQSTATGPTRVWTNSPSVRTANSPKLMCLYRRIKMLSMTK
jgi:hypothetical protein